MKFDGSFFNDSNILFTGERVAAAIENQNLWKLVENCIKDDD